MTLGRPLLLAVFALLPRLALADPEGLTEAKAYFKAGAEAYAAGDYLAAIQALEAAYRLTPLPAIAFSLAQAERRQYFVSRERVHLARAMELFRDYLKQVPVGGRRADATDALAQLEPLALSIGAAPAVSSPDPGAAGTIRTRLMVSSETPGASIALDGAPPVPAPLIAEVTPGSHSVAVSADGFFPSERSVVAVQGELVPIELPLRERPSVINVEAPSDADLYVDGAYMGEVDSARRLELASGAHVFTLAKKGHEVQTIRLDLGRGTTQTVSAHLTHTRQRTAALALFVTSGVTLAGGIVLSAVAVHYEDNAREILEQREMTSIDRQELGEYTEAIRYRNRFRTAAVASFVVSATTLVTGLFLHELDQPNVRETALPPGEKPKDPGLQLGFSWAPGGATGVDAKVRF